MLLTKELSDESDKSIVSKIISRENIGVELQEVKKHIMKSICQA